MANWERDFLAQRKKKLQKENKTAAANQVPLLSEPTNQSNTNRNQSVKQNANRPKPQGNTSTDKNWESNFLTQRRNALLSNKSTRQQVQQAHRMQRNLSSAHDFLVDRERQKEEERLEELKKRLQNKYLSPIVAPNRNSSMPKQSMTPGTDPMLKFSTGKLTPAKMVEIGKRVDKKQGNAQSIHKKTFDLNQLKNGMTDKGRNAYIHFGRQRLDEDVQTSNVGASNAADGNAYEYAEFNQYTTNLQKESKQRRDDLTYLTKEEEDNYLYLYGAFGRNKAKQYYDEHLQELVHYRKALDYVKNQRPQQKHQTAQDITSAFIGGAQGSIEGINDALVGALGGDNTLKKSEIEFRNALIRGDERNSNGKNVALDVTSSIGNMAPSIALGVLSGGLGASTGVSSGISSATFGLSAGGGAYSDALNEGKSIEQARLYGAQQAIDEAVTNYLLNGIAAFGGGKLGKMLKNSGAAKAASASVNQFIQSPTGRAVAKNAGKLLVSMGEEAAQEYVQHYTEKIARNLIFGEKNEIRFDDPDALYSAMLGATTAGVLNVPSSAINQRLIHDVGKRVDIKEFSKELDGMDTIIHQTQNPKVKGKAKHVKRQIEIMMERESRGMKNSAYAKGMLADEIHEAYIWAAEESEKRERDAAKLDAAKEFYRENKATIESIKESTNNRAFLLELQKIDDKLENMAKDDYKRLQNSKFAKNNLEKRLHLLLEKVQSRQDSVQNKEAETVQTATNENQAQPVQPSQTRNQNAQEAKEWQDFDKMSDEEYNTYLDSIKPDERTDFEKMSDEEYERYLDSFDSDDEIDYVDEIDRLDELEETVHKEQNSPNPYQGTDDTQSEQDGAQNLAEQGVVHADDVERLAKEHNLSYTGIEERSKQFGERSAKAYIENYDRESAIPVNTYDEAFKIIYNQGRYLGRLDENISNAPQLAFLTRGQRDAIFAAGVRDRIAEMKTASVTDTPHKGGLQQNNTKGHEDIKAYLKKWGEYTGLQFALAKNLPDGTNGAYDKEEGIIYISPNAKNINATISHELTHFLQDYDIKGYQIFRDTVLEELITREDTTLESLIERYHKAYAAAGQELAREDVIDEIIADSTADFLNDHSFVNKIAKKQPSLAKKILDFFHDFIESIKGFMKDTQNNGVIKALKEKQELYENLRDIWAEQLANATSAYKAGDYTVKADANQNSYTKKFSIADTLKQQLEKISENKLQEVGAYVHIGKTSNFITDLLDIDEMNVYMTSKKARTVMMSVEQAKEYGIYKEYDNNNYHGLGNELFYEALVHSEQPIIAFATKGDKSKNENRIALVTDLHDNKGNPIIVIQELRKAGNSNVKDVVIDQAVTTYGKGDLKILLEKAGKGSLLFIDKKRGQESEHLSRIVQFDAPSISSLDLNKNIQRFAEIIKRQYEQILNEHLSKIEQKEAKKKKGNYDNEISKDINQLKKSIDVDSDIDVETVQEKNETLKAMNDILKKRLHVKGNYILKPNEIDSISEQILKDTNSTYQKRKLNAGLTRIFTYLTKNNAKKADAAIKVATDIMHDMLLQSDAKQSNMEEMAQYYANEVLSRFADVSEDLGSEYKSLEKRMQQLKTKKGMSPAAKKELLRDILSLQEDESKEVDAKESIQKRLEKLSNEEQISLIQKAYDNANRIKKEYRDLAKIQKENYEQKYKMALKQAQHDKKKIHEGYKELRKKEREMRSDSNARNELLKQARSLRKLKGSAEFEKKKLEIIGNLDLEAVSMHSDTRLDLSRYIEWSQNMEENDDFYIRGAEHQKAFQRLNAKQIKDLSATEVAALTQAIIELKKAKENEKSLINEKGIKTIEGAAKKISEEMHYTGGQEKSDFKHMLNKFLTYQLDPIRAFKFFTGYKKDSTLVKLINSLNEGQLGKTRYTKGAYEIFDKLLSDENFTKDLKTMNIPIMGKNGESAYISKAMRISIMLHSQNLSNMRHIVKGGLTVPDKAEYEKGNIARAYRNGENIVLGKSMVKKIVESATKEEKEFVNLARKYFDEYAAKELNKTTNILLGHDRAIVKGYYPIISNPDYLEKESQGVFLDARFHNSRELKERSYGTGPILLEDVTERLVREINNTGNYVNLAIPIRNLKKVMNHRSFAEGVNNSLTVRALFDKQWDGQFGKYLDDLIGDIEGARRAQSSFLDRLRGKFAGAVLSANLSVTLQQLSAYPTAASVVGYKPLLKALVKGGKGKSFISEANREEINKYTPLMWYREQGNRSTELGEVAKTKTLGIRTKFQEFTSDWLDWVGKSDNAVVGRMWDVSKYYVSDNLAKINKQNHTNIEEGTDAYFEEVAKVFNQIVEETQSNYTTMQRAPLLRTTNQSIRALTMFYTQRAQNFGIMFDAYGEYKARLRDYNFKKNEETKADMLEARTRFQRAMTSQIIASAMGAVAKLVAAMILGKMKRYKDEKGDVSTKEMLKGVFDETLASMAGNVLLGSEIYQFADSIITGSRMYDVESPSVSTINGIMQNSQSFIRSIQDYVKSDKDEREQNMKKVKKNAYYLSLNVSQATSIPLKNVLDLSNAAIMQATSIFEGRDLRDWYFKESDVKESKFYDKIFQDFYENEDYNEFTRGYQKAIKMYGKEKASKAMVARLRDTEEVQAAAEAMTYGNFNEVETQKNILMKKFSKSPLLTSFVDTSIQKEFDALQKNTAQKENGPDEEITPVVNEKSKEWTQNGYSYLEFVYYSKEMGTFQSEKDVNGKTVKSKQEKIAEYLKNLPIDEKKKRILWSTMYKGEYLVVKK